MKSKTANFRDHKFDFTPCCDVPKIILITLRQLDSMDNEVNPACRASFRPLRMASALINSMSPVKVRW